MTGFTIHPQLLNDCHRLGRYPVSHLLLHRNAAVPWFILVPETGVPDLLDLPPADRDAAIAESAAVAAFVKDTLGWPKVNFGAIGNLVPQLHLHVVGRRSGDACWPAPVWGNLPEGETWAPAQVDDFRARLVAATGLSPTGAD